MPISDLLVPVFGPSLVAVEDTNLKCILYCVGLDLKTNKTIIQSWSEALNKWTIIKDNVGADLKFGFSALIHADKEKLYIVGGIDKNYQTVSGKVVEFDLKTNDIETGSIQSVKPSKYVALQDQDATI